ncbi:hypothetical protein GBA52_010577 [Prunus armeniaca]|nr:hypothetical protein GBA52_010577 [Prunus armeniaca]
METPCGYFGLYVHVLFIIHVSFTGSLACYSRRVVRQILGFRFFTFNHHPLHGLTTLIFIHVQPPLSPSSSLFFHVGSLQSLLSSTLKVSASLLSLSYPGHWFHHSLSPRCVNVSGGCVGMVVSSDLLLLVCLQSTTIMVQATSLGSAVKVEVAFLSSPTSFDLRC